MKGVFRLRSEIELHALKRRMGTGRTHTMEGSRPEKLGKYGNRRFKNEEGSWDSEKEYRRWQELKLLEKSGQIQDLKRQVDFELIPVQMWLGKRLRPIVYRADFTYTEAGKPVVEDVKGYRNKFYALKKRMLLWIHKIEIYET